MRRLGLIFMLQVAFTASAQDAVNVQSYTREIGYTLGDIARQTLTVTLPHGYHLDASSLPAQGKGGSHMELKQATWDEQDEKTYTRHVITLDWQIFRVMQEVRSFPLRPLELQFRRDGKTLSMHVDAARVLVSSILPTAMDAEHMTPRADIAPLEREMRTEQLVLIAASLGLLFALAYFAWRYDWLGSRFRARHPFRKAFREIRALNCSGQTTFSEFQCAVRILRQACDASAGVAITAEQLSQLFTKQLRLQSLRGELEVFYAESERIFFAGATATMTLGQVLKLSRRLMLEETP